VDKLGHGTKLSVPVSHHFLSSDAVSEMLSARFISTPVLSISVNGKVVPLHEHPGVVDQSELIVDGVMDFPDFARHSEELKCNSKRGCYEQGQTIHTAV